MGFSLSVLFFVIADYHVVSGKDDKKDVFLTDLCKNKALFSIH